MQTFWFILQSVAPVFLIAFLGIFLKKIRIINDQFVHDSSRLVFTVSLPVLIFTKLSTVDFATVFHAGQITFALISTFLSFFVIWAIASRFIPRCQDLGTFVQGSFRSNYAILGFAINANVFGEEILAITAVILAFIMPLYNLLSVIVLTVTGRNHKSIDWPDTAIRILKNPLIVAVFVSLPFSLLKIHVPIILNRTTEYLAALTLPLALIGIGGSLDLPALKRASKLAVSASIIKVVLIPALWTPVAVWLGFRGLVLGALFVMFASPTAVASFVMAKTMDGNARLAGNIVLISTLASSITITTGLFLLKSGGLI